VVPYVAQDFSLFVPKRYSEDFLQPHVGVVLVVSPYRFRFRRPADIPLRVNRYRLVELHLTHNSTSTANTQRHRKKDGALIISRRVSKLLEVLLIAVLGTVILLFFANALGALLGIIIGRPIALIRTLFILAGWVLKACFTILAI